MADVNATQRRLSDLRRTISEARAVPISTSCMVNRADVLAAIDDITVTLHDEVDECVRLAVEESGKRNWDSLDQTAIVQEAKLRAAQIQAQARAEQEELLAEADRYVETRLAAFEAELQVTLSRVAVMRERLMSRVVSDSSSQEQTTIMPKWAI